MNRFKLLIMLLLLLVVFGVSREEKDPIVKAGDMKLKPGTYKIKEKEYKADYGTLTVPENRTKKGSRLITLPVVRIHASGKEIAEPILFLSGPSASREAWSRRYTENEGWLLEHHDIFMVGYRGVFGSVLLDCPEVVEAKKVEKKPLSAKNLEKLAAAYYDCFKRLKKEGVDIDGYTMVEMIDDMEAARKALGYKKINLRGWSYGTRLAYIYGLRYPESIHRTVLVGTVAPGRFLGLEPAVVDAKLNHYGSLWKKDPTCTSRTSDIIKTMRDMLKTLPRQWHFYRIDPDKVKFMTLAFFSSRNAAAMVFDAYAAAAKGDYSGLAYLSIKYDMDIPRSGVQGDRPSKYGSADFDPKKDYVAEMDPSGSILGSPMAKQLGGAMQYGGWPIKLLHEKFRTPQYSDVETLIISGNNDFIAPVEYVKKDLLPYLRKGKLVILAERGHWDLMRGDVISDAFKHLVETFYLEGIVDDSKFEYIPMNFTHAETFQQMGKRIFTIDSIAKTMAENDINAAVKEYHRLRKEFSSLNIGERELNVAGYKLLEKNKVKEAMKIFKYNVKMHPKSANVYDSLGEAYMEKGDKKLAIKNFKKSLELNPRNTNAIQKLNRLQKGKR